MKKHTTSIYSVILIGIILSACASPTPPPATPTRQPTPEPTREIPDLEANQITLDGYEVSFDTSACNLNIPDKYTVQCGDMTVPEDRSKPHGRKVVLPVAVFRTKNPNPAPDPVFYLAGGGGYDHLAYFTEYLLKRTGRILNDRDYIMYNQRGAPHTEPALECPGYSDFYLGAYKQKLSDEEFDAQHVDFLVACHDTLVAEGHDLTVYNSAENAADLNDLRLVLGYDQINIYGASYGTKLGLTAMRDYPEGIRSAILDSVYPPQVDLYVPYAENAFNTFNILFEDCKADENCAAKYPDLESELYAVVDKLNANPKLIGLNAGDIYLDGSRYLFALSFYFYGSDNLSDLPMAIHSAYQGNFGEISRMVPPAWSVSSLSWGMFFSMQCREEIPFTTRDEMAAIADSVPPQLSGFFASPFRFDMCESWQAGVADPIENEAVVSDIPTLILGGHYDLETPSKWGALISETLSNSYFYEFPGVAHGVMRSNSCALDIGLEFINNPPSEPDTSCLADEGSPTFK